MGATKRLSVGNDRVRVFRTIPVAGIWRENERWVSIGGREACYWTVTVITVGGEGGWPSGSGAESRRRAGGHEQGDSPRLGEGRRETRQKTVRTLDW